MLSIPVIYIIIAVLAVALALMSIATWRLIKAISIRASEKGVLDGPISLRKVARVRWFHLLGDMLKILRRL